MKYRKMMPILEEKPRKKPRKKDGKKHQRVTIPIEIRELIKTGKKDFIEWEVDTIQKTLKGKLIRNTIEDENKSKQSNNNNIKRRI